MSKLCKFIDEHIAAARTDKNWSVDDVDAAFRMIVDESYTTTLFDSLTKNLENNRELHDAVLDIVINGRTMSFNISDPVINFGHIYGILAKAEDGRCKAHNRIFEQRIYTYMLSKLERRRGKIDPPAGPDFIRGKIADPTQNIFGEKSGR